jgi:hypothetical protein
LERSDQNVRLREVPRKESARAENRKGEEQTHLAGRFASNQVRLGDARGPMEMETPKRDRPEAGRLGQRERDQRALQGTKTLREAPDQQARAETRGTLCRP